MPELTPPERLLDTSALEREARWTERDRLEAEAFWRRFAPPLLVSLLLAE